MCKKVEVSKTFLSDFILSAPAVLKCSGVVLGLEDHMSAGMLATAQKSAEWALVASEYCAETLTHKGLLEILREHGSDASALKAMTCLKAELGVFCNSPEEFRDAKRAARDLFPKVKGEPQVELLMGDPDNPDAITEDMLEAITTGEESEEELKAAKDIVKEQSEKAKKPNATSELMSTIKGFMKTVPEPGYNTKASLEENLMQFFEALGAYGAIKVSDVVRETSMEPYEAINLVRERYLKPRVQVFAAELTLNMLKDKK